MTSARDHIFEKIDHGAAPTLCTTEPWSTELMVPAYTRQPQSVLIDMFIEKILATRGQIDVLATVADVPSHVARIVSNTGLDESVVVSDLLENLPWAGSGIKRTVLDLSRDGIIAVTDCFAGVAETGTIVTLNNGGRDSRLNYVSAYHIVVLDVSAIVGPYEDVWHRMAEADIAVPRAVNFITGPSRTADIEQTIELGAHGPGKLHILLVNPAA